MTGSRRKGGACPRSGMTFLPIRPFEHTKCAYVRIFEMRTFCARACVVPPPPFPELPMSTEDVKAKFRSLTEGILAPETQDSILARAKKA